MFTRCNYGSYYVDHQQAAELYDKAAQAYAEAKEHHVTRVRQMGKEDSKQTLEHSQPAHPHAQQVRPEAASGHAIAALRHEDITALAHELWRARGCPEGSPEEDWFHAAEHLRARK